MSKEITQQQHTLPPNPFARTALPSHVSAGTVAIESERAIAEAQGKLVIAKRFPRDPFAAFNAAMAACSRRGLAEEAIYSYPRGGQTVSGPSIRLAEELARCWGNIDYGMRELSQRDGVSEMEAYAWDMETNTISSQKFTVRHVRDKKDGGQALTDQRDIYELTANMAARRMRARILAILPPDLVDSAVAACRKTLAGQSDQPIEDRVRAMLERFGKLGITQQMIEARLGHPVAQILPDEFADLTGMYQSLKNGMTKASDWFAPSPANDNKPAAGAVADAINAGAKTRAGGKKGAAEHASAQAAQPPEPPAAGGGESAAPTTQQDGQPAGDEDFIGGD